MADERALMAARNNADWYESLFEVHGRRYERLEQAFLAIDAPPPFHSWVTITAPDLGAELRQRLAEMAQQHDFVVKDSFCSLDLEALRLRPFIEASWICSRTPSRADTSQWQRVESAVALERWEHAWSDGSTSSAARQFPATMLDRGEIACWGRVRNGIFDAGVIANRSEDCVGMSNLFGDDVTLAATWLCSGFGNGLPVVGYEWNEALDQAEDCGFSVVGPLRICGRT